MSGVVFGHAAVLNGDVDEGTVHVLCHVLLVAADVEVRPVLEPIPNFLAVLLESMLDVDFLFLVTGPCGCELVEVSLVNPSFNGVLIVEFGLRRLIAKEEPVPTAAPVMDALFHEGSEWSDSSPGPNHDDVDVLVVGEDEGFGW